MEDEGGESKQNEEERGFDLDDGTGEYDLSDKWDQFAS